MISCQDASSNQRDAESLAAYPDLDIRYFSLSFSDSIVRRGSLILAHKLSDPRTECIHSVWRRIRYIRT